MARRSKLYSVVAAVGLVLTLGGCGSTGRALPALDAAGSAKAATGPQITGKGYSYHTPSDWSLATAKVRQIQPQVDTAATSPQTADNFHPNINVIVKPGAYPGSLSDTELSKAERSISTQLKGIGATDVHVQPRVALAGETALHITSLLSQGSVKYQTDQYLVLRNGDEYVITFSVPMSYQESQRLAVTQPILASWKWSSRP